MKTLIAISILIALAVVQVVAADGNKSLYDIPLKDIDGKDTSLKAYKGKVLLVVNVASKCGLTPQYSALEELQKKYESKGFTILAFPCNDFAGQEPGSPDEIKKFCSTKPRRDVSAVREAARERAGAASVVHGVERAGRAVPGRCEMEFREVPDQPGREDRGAV